MEQQTKIQLLQELVELHDTKTPYLDEVWETEPLDRYVDASVFEREQKRIFRRLPQLAAHSSELPGPGSYLTLELAGLPLILVRDEEGTARAFYNVCRHRGARLVGEGAGCQRRFSCPYHAWTYDSRGNLIGVPHEKTGFPGLDRNQLGLKAVACEEYGGWIWVCLEPEGDWSAESHLGPLAQEFLALDSGAHVVFDSVTRDIGANWKILAEGGLEAYHFRVAHRETIAPLFLDNLSSYRRVGNHLRSVLPRSSLSALTAQPEQDWDIGKHSNLLYTLFPGSQFLVQEDHFVWIRMIPLAADRTRLRLATMVPADSGTGEMARYWQSNHDFTLRTLNEDFALGEGIQEGLASGANEHLNFGRYEGALAKFNQIVDAALANRRDGR